MTSASLTAPGSATGLRRSRRRRAGSAREAPRRSSPAAPAGRAPRRSDARWPRSAGRHGRPSPARRARDARAPGTAAGWGCRAACSRLVVISPRRAPTTISRSAVLIALRRAWGRCRCRRSRHSSDGGCRCSPGSGRRGATGRSKRSAKASSAFLPPRSSRGRRRSSAGRCGLGELGLQRRHIGGAGMGHRRCWRAWRRRPSQSAASMSSGRPSTTGTRPAGAGHVEGVAHVLGDALGLADDGRPFHERGRAAAWSRSPGRPRGPRWPSAGSRQRVTIGVEFLLGDMQAAHGIGERRARA